MKKYIDKIIETYLKDEIKNYEETYNVELPEELNSYIITHKEHILYSLLRLKDKTQKQKYVLLGTEAVNIYTEESFDELLKKIKEGVILFGTVVISMETSLNDILHAIDGWEKHVYIKKEEYRKIMDL